MLKTSLSHLLSLIAFTTLVAAPMASFANPGAAGGEQKLNRELDEAYAEWLEASPTELTRQGSALHKSEWDDLSPEAARRRVARLRARCRALEGSSSGLGTETRLSLQLFQAWVAQEEANLEFLDYDYPVNQMYGWQSEVPAFLANAHSVKSLADAQAYVERLEALPSFFDELQRGLLRREKKGVMPPVFVFDYALSDIDNLLKGFPLNQEAAELHPVWADFVAKVDGLQLDAKRRSELLERGRRAMRESFAPAYAKLRQTLSKQRARATHQDGVWKFPGGDRYYAHQLALITTTSLSAEEIHQLGLSEVKRIQGEMGAILKQVGFEGTLSEFFEHLRSDPRFVYSNNAAGREAYLKEANRVIDEMRAYLPKLFHTLPKARLEVRAVEGYREKSAGKAFYEGPPEDGSRPGYYYANLYDMGSMHKYSLEALAYHEAIPGHHMQISIAQELKGVPKFRRLGSYTAYIEGWGLYCEQLPKEHGFYKDPYSDFGRLNAELFRAARLVVDTGIHSKRWTRAQALKYYTDNTSNSPRDCQKMVDRHIVMAGQATAYKIGMLEILRLRAKASKVLGSRFDVRDFHDVVLLHGAVPLKVMEALVDDYIRSRS